MCIYKHMVCIDTQEILWVGQNKGIYLGEEDTMSKLQDFLFRNERLSLLFVDDIFFDKYEDSVLFWEKEEPYHNVGVESLHLRKGFMSGLTKVDDSTIEEFKNIILKGEGILKT